MGIKKEDEQRRVKEVETDGVVAEKEAQEDDKEAYLAELEAKLNAFPSYEDWLEEEGKKKKSLMKDSALARDTYEVYRDLAVVSGSIFEIPGITEVLDFLAYLSSSFSDSRVSSYKDFKNGTEEVRSNILVGYYHDASDLFDEEEEGDAVFAEDSKTEVKESEQEEPVEDTSKVNGDVIDFVIKNNTNVFVITDKSIADTVVKSIIGK